MRTVTPGSSKARAARFAGLRPRCYTGRAFEGVGRLRLKVPMPLREHVPHLMTDGLLYSGRRARVGLGVRRSLANQILEEVCR